MAAVTECQRVAAVRRIEQAVTRTDLGDVRAAIRVIEGWAAQEATAEPGPHPAEALLDSSLRVVATEVVDGGDLVPGDIVHLDGWVAYDGTYRVHGPHIHRVSVVEPR